MHKHHHTDEKGHHSPARSKIAQAMRRHHPTAGKLQFGRPPIGKAHNKAGRRK
jgi:hypothetical protein